MTARYVILLFFAAMVTTACSTTGDLSSDPLERPDRSGLGDRVTRPPGSGRGDIERLKLAVATSPKSADTWVALAWHLYIADRYAESEWVLAQARDLTPNDPYVVWLSGIVAYVGGDLTTSRTFLKRVYFEFQVVPDSVRMVVTFDLLGRLAFDDGDLSTAAYYFSKTIDLDSQNWQYHFLLGLAEWYRDRPYEAMMAFKQARQLNPGNALVLSRYAWALAADQERWGKEPGSERFREPLAATRQAIAADPGNYENYELLGLVFRADSKNEEAVAALRQSIQLAPNEPSPRFHLAQVLLAINTKDSRSEAERQLLRAIANAPGYWQVHRDAPHVELLIADFINTGRLREARAVIEWQNLRRVRR